MKKELLLLALSVLFLMNFVSAACFLNASMVNQDPYPAIPGESVKLVFQVNGVSNPDCKVVTFYVKENFPFSVDPESENPVIIDSGTYVKKYSSFYLAAYKIRIDEDALEGDTPIEVTYSTSSSGVETLSDFNVYIDDVRSDFEVYVKDYNANTQTITLEILNIGEVDVQALTVEVPNQDSIQVKGANREIVGDLDSNEYTTADFEASVQEGDFNLTIIYTDSVNIRRELNKTISFDPDYFVGLSRDKVATPIWLFVLIPLVIGFFVWRAYRKHKKKKLHQSQLSKK